MTDINSGILALVEKAKADYLDFMTRSRLTGADEIAQKMIGEFNAGISVEEGSKYIKIVTKHGSQSSVHSFVVKADGKKFRAGDILKAASWRAPATNFARGNVIDGTLDRIRWTGAL